DKRVSRAGIWIRSPQAVLRSSTRVPTAASSVEIEPPSVGPGCRGGGQEADDLGGGPPILAGGELPS
ncbi:unnamed protein product, partial [Musa textilis]